MAAGKLTARGVASAKPGTHGDGGGLYLIVSESGPRKWVYRFTWKGKVKMMGLGSADVVGLAEARSLRDEARKVLASGSNPIEARREAEQAEAGRPTFGKCADDFIASKASEWRNAKHADQWRMTLTRYAEPLRGMPVDEIDTEAILAVLQPVWLKTPETASRLRGRIEAVLDAARARGFIPRNEANPARWRGHLDKLLPKRQKLSRGHHAAMAYAEVPAFMTRLRERQAMSALALEFCILTAARSGEVLGARWAEIDFGEEVWNVPAQRMKAGVKHAVPLCGRAIEILQGLHESRTGDFVFPGQRVGKPLSNMAMEMVLRRMGVGHVTVHGFRSAFRDWAGDQTRFPREICEAALAHTLQGVEAAYRRGDALEKRRALMAEWDAYCREPAVGNVLKFKRNGGAHD